MLNTFSEDNGILEAHIFKIPLKNRNNINIHNFVTYRYMH